MAASTVAVVEKIYAQNLRQILEQKGVWDSNRRLAPIDKLHLGIPVLQSSDAILQPFKQDRDTYSLNDIQFRLRTVDLPNSKKSLLKSPFEKLKETLNGFLLAHAVNDGDWSSDLPSKWEKHGDLVLLPDKCFQRKIWNELVPDIWKVVCSALECKRLAKKSVVKSDEFRSPQVNLLLGHDGWVTQVDNGIKYTYDITRCMFSAGNITEKLRIAKFKCHGETVVDLFAGIGYFTLPYLLHAGADQVFACEWNPHAAVALRKNLKLNSIQDRCVVLEGDNRKVCPRGIADRVNLGLIPSSECSWLTACLALKPKSGGILHIHVNVTDKFSQQKNCGLAHDSKNTIQDLNTDSAEILANDSNSASFRCDDHPIQNYLDSSNKEGDAASNSTSGDEEPQLCPAWCQWAHDTSQSIRTTLCDITATNWRTNVLHIEHVKSYAPHVDHLVLDLECRPFDWKIS